MLWRVLVLGLCCETGGRHGGGWRLARVYAAGQTVKAGPLRAPFGPAVSRSFYTVHDDGALQEAGAVLDFGLV